MNISHEHKTIWWAPERCGTKATAHIFSKLGFEYFTNTDGNFEKIINIDGINYRTLQRKRTRRRVSKRY